MTTSSINTEGTSSVLSYTNSVFTTTTEMSSTVIVMKSIESFTSSSDYPLSSSTTGSSSTDLPTGEERERERDHVDCSVCYCKVASSLSIRINNDCCMI